MSFEGKQEYLQAIRERYKESNKKAKKLILDEFCSICEYSRKYAIRILNGKVEPRKSKPGPKPEYDEEVSRHLIILWEAMEQICSKKMVAAMSIWLEFYKPEDLREETRAKLLKISSSTIDRLLKTYKKRFNKGLSSTKPCNFIKSKIPIELLDSKIKKPGFIEADTVAHCGNTTEGEYVNTITMTDLASTWTENRAVWTKESQKVLEKIKDIEYDLPFPVIGFACDNGTEFLNNNLVDYFSSKQPKPVKFVRRRPYKKNDAAHVEQKNFTHVRQIFGYDRLDEKQIVPVMNEIYRAYWNPLHNFFIPTMKLIKKQRIGGKIKKFYDTPKTPYQRIMESEHIQPSLKRKLQEKINTYNPFTLSKYLNKRLKDFKELIKINKYNNKNNDITA